MFKNILLVCATILFALAVFDVKVGTLALIPGGLCLFAASFLTVPAQSK